MGKARPRILTTCDFHPAAIQALLKPCAQLVIARNEAHLRAEIARADALISMVTDPISASLLERGRRLRVVGNMAVGIDNVDLAACARLGIRVVHTPRVVTRATAELALALLFAAARRIPEGEAVCRRAGPWVWTPDLLQGLELRGRHAVLVGEGRIGRETARLFRAVGLTTEFVHLSDRAKRADRAAEVRAKLRRAQVLSLHVPLTPETHHWLDRARLACLPRDAIVVNTARGPVIDERALAAALRARRIFAAGLDVHEREPRVSPALRRLRNVVLLPHIGTATRETRRAMAELVITGTLGVLAGQPPWNEVSLTRYVKPLAKPTG